MTGMDGMLAMFQTMGLSAEHVHVLADMLTRGEPTVAEAYALLEDRIADWRRPAEAVERLLNGQPPRTTPSGTRLPAVDPLGEEPVRRLNELGERHVDQVRARVGAELVDADRARARTRRPADPRDNGHGAAQHSLDLVVGLAMAVERHLHLPMPIRDLRKPYQKRRPTSFSQQEITSWERLLLRRQDPDLDRLVLDVALASGARRGALCSIRLQDLDLLNCRLQLRGKGKPPYWVPVRRSLLIRLYNHAQARGAIRPGDGVLLRSPDQTGVGQPITRRYFDRLWEVLGDGHASEAPHTHRLRRTAAMRITRAADGELANRFLDHVPPGGMSTTYGYLDGGRMPDDVFLDKATAALGRFDDCPMPAPATQLTDADRAAQPNSAKASRTAGS